MRDLKPYSVYCNVEWKGEAVTVNLSFGQSKLTDQPNDNWFPCSSIDEAVEWVAKRFPREAIDQCSVEYMSKGIGRDFMEALLSRLGMRDRFAGSLECT